MTSDRPNSEPVTVSDWNACLNSGNGEIVLSCKVAADDPDATISGVGLILNNGSGMILASCYTELSGGSTSASPALNLPADGLALGDTVMGVVTGEAGGQHYFVEQELTIGSC